MPDFQGQVLMVLALPLLPHRLSPSQSPLLRLQQSGLLETPQSLMVLLLLLLVQPHDAAVAGMLVAIQVVTVDLVGVRRQLLLQLPQQPPSRSCPRLLLVLPALLLLLLLQLQLLLRQWRPMWLLHLLLQLLFLVLTQLLRIYALHEMGLAQVMVRSNMMDHLRLLSVDSLRVRPPLVLNHYQYCPVWEAACRQQGNHVLKVVQLGQAPASVHFLSLSLWVEALLLLPLPPLLLLLLSLLLLSLLLLSLVLLPLVLVLELVPKEPVLVQGVQVALVVLVQVHVQVLAQGVQWVQAQVQVLVQVQVVPVWPQVCVGMQERVQVQELVLVQVLQLRLLLPHKAPMREPKQQARDPEKLWRQPLQPEEPGSRSLVMAGPLPP